MSWMICGQSRRFWLRICASSGVRSRSLLHHTLQGHAVLGRDAAAVFIFWRIVRYRAVHARDFDPDLPPGSADTFPAAGERLARFIAPPNAQRGCLVEDQLREPGGILWFAQNCQQ